MSTSKHDLTNILAKLGNRSPHSKHIQLLEKLLRGTMVRQELFFKNILTDREVLCLLLAAKGLSSKEMANMLGLAERTIKTHRESICLKLRCNNIAQAIFESMRYGHL